MSAESAQFRNLRASKERLLRVGFWKERAIVIGFGAAACLFALGLILLNPRTNRYVTGGRRWTEANERAAELGITMLTVGVVLGLICLAMGLMIAFGVGPDFMAKRIKGVRVEERLVHFADGTTIFGDAGGTFESARCYLRLRLPNGEVTELCCSPKLYRKVSIGMIGECRAVGRRLVEFSSRETS